jgi:hypothetical protein
MPLGTRLPERLRPRSFVYEVEVEQGVLAKQRVEVN